MNVVCQAKTAQDQITKQKQDQAGFQHENMQNEDQLTDADTFDPEDLPLNVLADILKIKKY